jgi:hypothetical protein
MQLCIFSAGAVLILEMNGKGYHPGENFVQHIGILQSRIYLVNVSQPIAEFDFRRDGYKG